MTQEKEVTMPSSGLIGQGLYIGTILVMFLYFVPPLGS